MLSDGFGVSGWGGTLDPSGGGSGGAGATVTNYTPAEGAEITPSTPIEFDVTGATLNAIVVTVLFPQTGAQEVVYDRDGFGVNYAPTGGFAGSSRAVITGGYHFVIRRRGGWYLSPSVRVQGGTTDGGAITQ